MKIYICNKDRLPSAEVDHAIFLEANVALADRSPLTIIYALTEEARQIMNELPFKPVHSQVYESTFACVLPIEETKKYLADRFEVEYVSDTKDPA